MAEVKEIKKPVIKYEVRNGFLYVNESRYKIESINSVNIYSQYYLGLDDTPGVSECSLCINRVHHHLDFIIRDEDSKAVTAQKNRMLNDLAADIKKLINF